LVKHRVGGDLMGFYYSETIQLAWTLRYSFDWDSQGKVGASTGLKFYFYFFISLFPWDPDP